MTTRRGPLETAIDRALRSLRLAPEYEATVELGRAYARRIDADPGMLWRLGPRLLEVLADLGMTPKSRAEGVNGEEPRKPASPIDELRKRREWRNGGNAG